MTPNVVMDLANQIDVAFFLIGGAILLIEIAEAVFKRDYAGRTLWEMVVSASTQIPYLLAETLILTFGYGLYYVLSYTVVPWAIPVTVGSVIAVLILCDFIYYWEHRIAHEVRILWTQHAVHHSSRQYNIVTAIRFGPLEGLWSLIAHMPLIFMGFAPELVFFGVIVVLAYQTWLHTELIGKLGPFERVMNTPSHHRVHHGSDDKYLDKNYGGITIVWDRLFGTFQVEQETPRYGLKRDFDSKNPLVVWFSEWPGLIRDMAGARNWRQALQFLIKHPGWQPQPASQTETLPHRSK